ncbi:uncharacterized protein LOC106659091 [Trichogramma pretiosum]|uniref:Complex I-9kD n=1 Tax=Trichogramma kaykai TaxID=54128 RepID=A0ABD2X9M4_9HYME|nr:uncharacterized protein LOC106659091 [Trichogramma pretiosum]
MLRIVAPRFVSKRCLVVLNRSLTSDQHTSNKCGEDIPEVPGLSEKVVKVPNERVGYAGASKDAEYKCPEYFCYHVDSFGDSFVEMEKYRLPAPSALKPKK